MSDVVNLLTSNKIKILIKEINKQTVQLSKLIQQNAVNPTNSFDRKCINTQKKITLVKPFHGLHTQSMGMWRTINVLILHCKIFQFCTRLALTRYWLTSLWIPQMTQIKLNDGFRQFICSFRQNRVSPFVRLIRQPKCRYSLVFDYRPGLSCPQANIWQRIPPAGSICTPSYYWQIYADISRANLTSLILCVCACTSPSLHSTTPSLSRAHYICSAPVLCSSPLCPPWRNTGFSFQLDNGARGGLRILKSWSPL